MVNRRREKREETAPPFRSDDGRWEELLDTAARIFARKGYRSATLQDIADEFGVLKGSLYHYIRSKDDLLHEVIRAVLDVGLARLRDQAAVDLDPVERLRAIIRAHVLHLVDNLVGTTVLLHEFSQLSAERQATVPVREYQAVLEEQIDAARADPRVRSDLDPHLSALAILGATNWVYRWYRPGGTRTPEQIADYFATTLVDGLLEPSGATRG
ncbi:TetR family transcriptional regulator [Actinomycetospora sp. NBRC 106375]|uniref:TetR/AcrR family transcriptional regulator n=1 Tax=Actinomycetospora sp. NBRC 106375 TaxID=3032207 RepID=UPI0024A23F57|nr:TetR/AcrR family transcriptional regulator [Actinomycetospora sp. NBRC 106375]GLZ50190.1 TetR family transcriptional regulator [Actinomycetospora sp. NBRC 106375]